MSFFNIVLRRRFLSMLLLPVLGLILFVQGSWALSVGNRVTVVNGPYNVRASASTSGTSYGTKATGALGTVAGGPTSGSGFTWYNVTFDTAPSGWIVQDGLALAPSPGSFTISAVARCDTASPVAPAIKLTWSASSNATSYEVYRNGSLYTTVTGLTYDNTLNVVAGQTYSYYVVAKNSTGTTQSNSVSVPVSSSICGSAPGSLTVSAFARCDTASPVAPAIKLTWSASSNATSYEVYRNGSLYTTVTGLTYDNTLNVVAGQTYSYYVVAKNSTGTTQSNSVSVPVSSSICGSAPGSLTVSAFARCDTASPVAPAIKLTWSASSNATSYEVYRNGSLYTTVTGLTYDNTLNVVAGQTYSYYVVAKNSTGTTQSNSVSVPVSSSICGSAPGSLTVSAFARCDTASPVAPAIKLTWSASSNATSYEVYRNGSLYTTVTGLTYDNTLNVVAGQTYSYYVVAKNSTGTTQSNTVSIQVATNICGGSVGSLPALTLVSPSNGVTGIITSPTFIWNPVATATSYRIMIAVDPARLPTGDSATCLGLGCVYNDNTVAAANSFTASTNLLSAGTTYYWQVRAGNDAKQISPWSKKWSFTTAASLASLPAPTLSAPANGATGQSTLPTFSWQPVTGASDYRIMIAANQSDLPSGDVASCSNNCINFETKGPVSYTPQAGALNTGTTYYWQVRAATSSGVHSPWSQRSFTTAASASAGTVSNGSFEQGEAGWIRGGDFHVSTDKTNFPYPRSGLGYAWLAKTDGTAGDNLNGFLYQTITVPSNVNYVTLSLWYNITSLLETAAVSKDVLNVTLQNSSGAYISTVKILSNLDKQTSSGDYKQILYDLTPYRGQTIRLNFFATTDGYYPTTFRIDDVTISSSLELPKISGNVTKRNAGMSNVPLTLSGSSSNSITTDAYGGYIFPGLSSGTYTITPSLSNYSFNPASKQVPVSGTDVTVPSFKACYNPQSLSGVVIDNTTGTPLKGVRVVVDGTSVDTDLSTGNYNFSDLSCGPHTVTVTEQGYFSYTNRIDISTQPVLSINLTKPATVYGAQTSSGYSKDPVNTSTGNYIYQKKDLEISGRGLPVAFERNYNSQDATDGPLGYGWGHTYNEKLSVDSASSNVTIRHGDGKTETWTPDGSGGYKATQSGVSDTLISNGNGTYTLKKKDLTRYDFDASLNLSSITDKNANSISLAYTSASLTQLTDTAGRTIALTYDGNNRISTITDPIGRTIQYTYDTSGNLISSQDMNGNKTTYTYDANYQMLTVVDPRGNTVVTNVYDAQKRVVSSQKDAKMGQTTYDYNEISRKTTIVDQLGKTTTHYFDEMKRLIQEQDPLGNSSYYAYDAAGNRIAVTDKNGNKTQYTYDTQGNVLTKTDPLNNVTIITYDTNSNPLSRADAQGKITSYAYDANGNLVTTTDPLGNKTTITYNASGQPLTIKDPLGNTTTNTYDGQGNLAEVKNALVGKTTSTYDGVGRKLSVTDALSHTITYTYDNNNNVLSVTDPLGNVVLYTYDGNNNKLTAKDAKGNVTTYTYDVKDLLTDTKDPLGNIVTNTYDALDRKIAVKDKLGNVTNFTFDDAGNLLQVSDPLGNKTVYTYDPNGNKLSVSDPLQNKTSYIYDAMNRTIGVTAPIETVSMATTIYDSVGRVVSTTNAIGQTTALDYDAIGRLTIVTDANGGTVKYTYDANGNRLSMTDPNGNSTMFAYDALNRLIKKTEPLGVPYQYGYDAVGNVTSMTDPKGNAITYSYDTLNRLAKVTYPDSSTITYSYDVNGNRTAMADSLGTSGYQYDVLNRMTGYSDLFGKSVGYDYDANSNRVSLTYPDGKAVAYSYDADNRLISVKDWGNRTTTYAYDAAGRLTTTTNANGTTASYTYDKAGRLIGLANNPFISSYSYTLDAIGNHTKVDQTEPLMPILPAQDTGYTYDTENRATNAGGVANTFDANGNLTAKGADTFAYDFNDRLKSSTIGGVSTQYSYDGQGDRLAKTSGGTTVRYVLDINGKLSNVLAETEDNGAITAYYVYGLGLISKILPDGTAYTYHYDSRGSTIALTNAGQNMTDTYAYDIFGSVTNNNGTSQNSFRYVGKFGLMDEGNGLTYVRARYYSPGLGRFITKDPLTGTDGDSQSLNRYVYVQNNHLRLIDINGFSPQEGGLSICKYVSSDSLHAPWLNEDYYYSSRFRDDQLDVSTSLLTDSLKATISQLGGMSYRTKSFLDVTDGITNGISLATNTIDTLGGVKNIIFAWTDAKSNLKWLFKNSTTDQKLNVASEFFEKTAVITTNTLADIAGANTVMRLNSGGKITAGALIQQFLFGNNTSVSGGGGGGGAN